MKVKTLAMAVALGMAWSTSGAFALPTPVSCPGTVDTKDREFILTTDPGATCFMYGDGNINGNDMMDPIIAAGYSLLSKSDSPLVGLEPGSLTGTPIGLQSGSTGTFSLTAAVLAAYTDIVIAFKSGANLTPVWASFKLPAGVSGGKWQIDPTQNLSHANLYGKPSVVPVPGAGLLLLTVAGGLGLMKHRRRAKA